MMKNVFVMVDRGHINAGNYGMEFFDMCIKEYVKQSESAK